MTTHVVPIRVYVTIFLALCGLTVLTVAAAERDFGPFNTLVALGIATTKATLVILYFMHVRYSGRLTILVLLSGFVWLGILIVFTLNDYVSRAWPMTPGG